MKKKFTLITLLLLITISSFAVAKAATNTIGKVIGQVYSTDIITYIDKSPIQSANIGGRTMIAAEDMKDFGFDVKWDPEARRLDITSPEIYIIKGKVIIPDAKVAPKGGVKVTISAWINPNSDPSLILSGYFPMFVREVECVIPEGQSSINYRIGVPKSMPYNDDLGFRYISNYVLLYRYEYYIGDFKAQHGSWRQGYLDMSTGDKENVDYVLENIQLN